MYERSRDHIHNYGEWEIVIDPNCTEAGLRERYCNCGDKQIGQIAALGHNIVEVGANEADCTHKGNKAYIFCLYCEFTTYEETEALGHDFGEWELTKEATCISYGEERRVCLRDPQHIETRQTDKCGHSMSAWKVERAATCETDGAEYRSCSVCNAVEKRKTEAIGHKFGEWVQVTSPTCTEDGLEKRICVHDETHIQTRKTDKTGHTPTGWLTERDASCTEDGVQHIKCSTCLEKLDERTVKATGHTPTGWLSKKNASCTADGVQYIECSTCFIKLDERTVAATGHKQSDWLTERYATCTENGLKYIKCLNCSERLIERTIEATGHSFGEWQQTSAPTCSSVGEEKRICRNDASHVETREVAKTEHRYEILSSDANSHILKCALCQNEVYKPHVWNDNDCTVCGYRVDGTKGIEYGVGGDESYLVVLSTDKVTSDNIIVPLTYNGVKVCAIGEKAFNNSKVKGIYLPSDITIIEKGAFADSENLQYLKLPFIGLNRDKPENLSYLFYSELNNEEVIPQSLKTVELSYGITELPNATFKSCDNVTKIILPDSVEVLGEECFYGCSSLEEVTLPDVITIGQGAFWGCSSLKSITIPESVTEIGLGAFNGVNENCNIVFRTKSGWYLYYQNGEKADEFKEELFKNFITYNNMFIFKRETTDVA